MAKIQLVQPTQVGSRRVGAVKPPLSLADRSGQAALGQAVAQVSGDIFRQMTATKAANEEATFRGIGKSEIRGYGAFVEQNPNLSIEELQKEQEAMMGRIKTAAGKATTRLARTANENWLAERGPSIERESLDLMAAIKSNQELAVYEIHQKTNMDNLDAGAYTKLKERMVKEGLLNKEIADAQEVRDLAIIDRAMDKIEVDNIKPLLIESLGEELDKQAGLATLSSELDRLKKEGVLTEAEAAEQDKVLGDWIDNFVAGRKKAVDNAAKLTTLETYTGFLEPVTTGSVSFDDVETSSMSKDDKESWQKYIKGSYEDAPTETIAKGFTDSTGAVFEAASLEISKKEAYDDILTARFVDRSINEDQYNWAIDKIENPYQKNIMADLRSTMKNNTTSFRDFHSILFRGESPRDAAESQKVNEALVSWLDRLIEKDAVPLFDLKKKMFAMSSQFRVNNGTLVDIGDTVLRNGEEWEVIGFYEDGEPSWERVEDSGIGNGGGFNPLGRGFDLETFKESGGVPDETGHMGSFDPRTGMLLKGMNHPTIGLTLAEEKKLGNKVIKRGDRFFTVPDEKAK